jgi:hypothetical protein
VKIKNLREKIQKYSDDASVICFILEKDEGNYLSGDWLTDQEWEKIAEKVNEDDLVWVTLDRSLRYEVKELRGKN